MFMKELILLKCSYYARQGICKAVYIFKVIPIQNFSVVFHRIRTDNSKICMKVQKTPKLNLKKLKQS